ncbi:MAG: S-layer homology domain-containing protein [Oscillatoriales cyanobacterium C42_A2020_001]|nr:S-layer homology domain-containing protein [Leptolyngbyaceae cyanobacterium C42_A2020_001]
MNENASKILTATVLCSLSGIAFWSAIRSLSDLRDDTAPDAEQNPKDAAPEASSKTTAIASPEKLSKSPAKPVPKPAGRVKPAPKVAPADSNTKPLPIAPYWQRSPEGLPAMPVVNMAPPEAVAMIEKSQPDKEPIFSLTSQSLPDLEGHWGQFYVEFLAARRVVQGFPDGKFHPDRAVTPAQFNLMARKAFPGIQAPVSYRELQATIASRAATRADAAAYIYRAVVKIEPAPIVTSIKVNGEVSRPGDYSLAAMSNENLKQEDKLPTVSRAIQQAGGSLENANLQQVEIHRLTETGTKKVIKVNVARTLETGDYSQDAVLQQDDQLVVPAIAQELAP